MYYYLCIGSNINPKQNFEQIIMQLLKAFTSCYIYPAIKTTPENLSTDNHFLNSLAVIYSEKDEKLIKQILNEIEESLGRDRNDPLRGEKDRTADIDIMTTSSEFDLRHFSDFSDSFIQEVLQGKKPSVALKLGSLVFRDGPAAIHFNATTGQIRIIENELDSLDNGIKSRFLSE